MKCCDWQLRPSDHHLINSRLNFDMMFVWYDAVVQIQLQSEWTLSAEASPAVNLSSRHFLLAGSKKHVSVRRLRQTAFKDPSLSISCWRKASDLTAQQDVCLSVWSWYLNQNMTSFLSDTCSRREVQVKNLITMAESFIVRSIWSRVRRLLRLIQIRAPDLIHAPWRMNSLQMN